MAEHRSIDPKKSYILKPSSLSLFLSLSLPNPAQTQIQNQPFQNILKPSSLSLSLPKLSQISFKLYGWPPSLITTATTTIGGGFFFSFSDRPSFLYLSIRSNSYLNGSSSSSLDSISQIDVFLS